MDKEIRNRHWRIVGALESVEKVVKHAEAMPCDSGTRALLEIATMVMSKAVLSAWNYADARTSESEKESP